MNRGFAVQQLTISRSNLLLAHPASKEKQLTDNRNIVMLQLNIAYTMPYIKSFQLLVCKMAYIETFKWLHDYLMQHIITNGIRSL